MCNPPPPPVGVHVCEQTCEGSHYRLKILTSGSGCQRVRGHVRDKGCFTCAFRSGVLKGFEPDQDRLVPAGGVQLAHCLPVRAERNTGSWWRPQLRGLAVTAEPQRIRGQQPSVVACEPGGISDCMWKEQPVGAWGLGEGGTRRWGACSPPPSPSNVVGSSLFVLS